MAGVQEIHPAQVQVKEIMVVTLVAVILLLVAVAVQAP
jgi:hypothetical protein